VSLGHDVDLITFREDGKPYLEEKDLWASCQNLGQIRLPNKRLSPHSLFHVVTNMLTRDNVAGRAFAFLTFYYSAKMSATLKELTENAYYDIMFVDHLMLFNAINCHIRKVLEVRDAVVNSYYQLFRQETKILPKALLLLRCQQLKHLYLPKYKLFDLCIVPAAEDRSIIQSELPGLRVQVVPYGVDTEYFKPIQCEEDHPSVVFVGDMSYLHNVVAVTHFVKKILPIIREAFRDIRMYIVGRDPANEVLHLASDNSIIVTGYVKDVRQYLAMASVVVIPMVTVAGIKTKLLEAMAMGKPVVSTSIGVRGVEAKPDEDVFIRNDPQRFAQAVIWLLSDPALRKRIGTNARKTVESMYTWEETTKKLDLILKGMCQR